MCQGCIYVITKWFGPLKNYGFASPEPAAQLIWDATAFPFCDPETLDRQIREFVEACEKCESICYVCGRHVVAPDQRIYVGEECEVILGTGKRCPTWDKIEANHDRRNPERDPVPG